MESGGDRHVRSRRAAVRYYRLMSQLSRGCFAEAYLGKHIHLGTRATIKVLSRHLLSEDLTKFEQEACTIAHLVHPNIIRVFDLGSADNTLYLVMDYAPSGTLRERHPKGQGQFLLE
ncbi:serine/threonine protein kinase [Ktedonosporobacter rubrisoli]|uniref:non-specific serine/threonine protein kinase n=1 Tax=Ktedonosporobacter rubrisoli TaxID=2509675 RepID=A0A4P6JZB7_KTERU|nr:protein kinase [Ktedonosporobacter rubrisoli]QBD81238.1 serine/threonine protein kinase [Ktedonosporobacter rubrisoli]